jgi:hypothetical protein
MLTLSEIEQYGLDSFADADYISIYGMPPNLLSELPDGQGANATTFQSGRRARA